MRPPLTTAPDLPGAFDVHASQGAIDVIVAFDADPSSSHH
jgi:hypothetical protein